MSHPERCPWPGSDPLMIEYHDREWGVAVHDDRRHYEFLVLEAAQAGLSWRTVLHKRARYREVFAGFDFDAVARYGQADVERLLTDPGIIRNRRKVEAAVENARRLIEVREEHGSFDAYLWAFVSGRPVVNRWERLDQLPPRTPLSDDVSADLKRRGFRFVGSTVIYAHLQAAGLVNDHLATCFRWPEVARDHGTTAPG